MNLSALEHQLFQLTDSEKRYKNGYHFEGWKELKKEKIDGRTVLRLPEPFNDNKVSWNSKSFTGGYSLYFAENMAIKRNSRYSPVPEHVHSNIELNYVYSGSCPQVINGLPITLEKNQVLLIDTDCPHSIEALGDNDIMLSIMLPKEFLREHMFSQFSKDSILSQFFIQSINNATKHDHYLLFHSENDRRIPMFFREFFCECYDPSINSGDILLHLFYVIMAELINVYENDIAVNKSKSMKAPVAPIIRYIQQNYRSCTLNTVADFFHISPNYVTKILKKYTGMTFIQLLQEQRMKVALELLRNSTLSVTEIADEVGYENVTFFYKKFKKKYGYMPGDVRRE